MDDNRPTKSLLPLSLAWVVLVAFLMKLEVSGAVWARSLVMGK